MHRDPTFRQLQVFVTTVQSKSFGAAARTLGISQFAVSKHVAALEKAIGEPLFRRAPGRPVKLTARGQSLVDTASTLLTDRQNIDGPNKAESTQHCVHIGAGEMVLNRVFYPSLANLYAAQPDIEVLFTPVASTLSTIAGLSDHGIDVAYLMLNDTPEFVSGRSLGHLDVGIYGAPSLIEHLHDDEPMPILPPAPGGALARELNRYLGHAPVRPFKRARIAQTGGAALDLALHGQGACCIPAVDAEPHIETHELQLIDKLKPLYVYSFIARQQPTHLDLVVQEYFAAALKKYFALQ